MSIKSAKIENFTVFENLSIEFASGVNVIIGENGTGKTHLMKLICADKGKGNKLSDYFKGETFSLKSKVDEFLKELGLPKDDETLKLILKTINDIKDTKDTKEDLKSFNETITFKESFEVMKFAIDGELDNYVFIPAKEMLTHSKGLPEMVDKYGNEMPFDKSLIDIIEVSRRWKLSEIPEIGKNIIPTIEKIIGGKVVLEDDVFYIEKDNGNLINFSMEAEGIKKIALIWQLIMNESITKGSVLFWDEADSNVNPKLLSRIAELVLELSRQGVQIFVTSHSYVLAKYIEVLMQDSDDVLFHSLYRNENNVVECESDKKLSDLFNNPITKENIELYKAEIARSLG